VYFTRVLWDDGLPLPMTDSNVISGYTGKLTNDE
jgi:hypothetical protein